MRDLDTMTNGISRRQWYALPSALRWRWLEETEFDRKPPSPDLQRAVEIALKKENAKDAI